MNKDTDHPENLLVSPVFGGWPVQKFLTFKQFAQEEAGDNYWVAVSLLMARNEELQRLKFLVFDTPEPEQEEVEKPVTLDGPKRERSED